jgi:hypothetical protein
MQVQYYANIVLPPSLLLYENLLSPRLCACSSTSLKGWLWLADAEYVTFHIAMVTVPVFVDPVLVLVQSPGTTDALRKVACRCRQLDGEARAE